jgi:hypothetical protein
MSLGVENQQNIFISADFTTFKACTARLVETGELEGH